MAELTVMAAGNPRFIVVMPGLVPGIHVLKQSNAKRGWDFSGKDVVFNG